MSIARFLASLAVLVICPRFSACEEFEWKPVNPAVAAARPSASPELIIPESKDALGVDMTNWRNTTVILVFGENDAKLYLQDKLLDRIWTGARAVCAGFLPAVSNDDRLWFYVTLQKADVHQAAVKISDARMETNFYAWDGRRIRRALSRSSVAYRRMDPAVLSQRPGEGQILGGPVHAEWMAVELSGRLQFSSLGIISLPPGVTLYDFVRGDLDGHGDREIICAEGDDRAMVVYSEDGRRLWNQSDLPMAVSPAAIHTPYWVNRLGQVVLPLIFDADGDGKNEVLAAVGDLQQEHGILFDQATRGAGTKGARLSILKWVSGNLQKQWETDPVPGELVSLFLDGTNRPYVATKEKGAIRIHAITIPTMAGARP